MPAARARPASCRRPVGLRPLRPRPSRLLRRTGHRRPAGTAPPGIVGPSRPGQRPRRTAPRPTTRAASRDLGPVRPRRPRRSVAGRASGGERTFRDHPTDAVTSPTAPSQGPCRCAADAPYREGARHEEGGLRGGAAPAAGRAGQDAGVGAHRGRSGSWSSSRAGTPPARAARSSGSREYLNPRVARIAALPAPDRARADPVVLPALRRAPAGGRRDRAVRPQLVQPRRRRAGDGLLHARASTAGSCTSARSSSGCSSRTASCCASTGSRSATRSRSAGSSPRLKDPMRQWKLSPMDLESIDPLGGLLPRQGRDVRAHRHPRGAVVRRRERRQAPRPDQHDRPPALQHPLPEGAAGRRWSCRKRPAPTGYVRTERWLQTEVPDHAATLS